mgnify:FL=1
MKIAIIGSGITGLSAAYRLTRNGHEVVVYEASSFNGGQASTLEISGNDLEKAYHHLFVSDSHILTLYKELNISDELEWFKSSVATYTENNIWPTTTILDILKLRPLSMKQRFSLLLISLRLKLIRDWKKLENITAYDWLKNKVEKKTFEIIFEPLLRGKFGRYYKTISLPWFWSKLQTRVASRNHKFQEILCYPKNSFKSLIETLVETIESNNGSIKLNHIVTKINIKNNKVESINVKNSTEEKTNKFDSVISTVPYHILNKIVKLPDQILINSKKVDYMAAVVMIIVSKYKLSNYYWLSIAEKDFPFLGVIEHTNLIPKYRYNNNNIIYKANYVEGDHPLLSKNFNEVYKEYEPYLKKINSKFNKDWIIEHRFNKINYAQPIIPINYSSYKIPIELPVNGLYCANTAQIYPEDRGTNYSVDLGENVSKLIMKGK